MTCIHCGNELLPNTTICSRCGHLTGEVTQQTEVGMVDFFVTSPKQLAILSIITSGLYELFWFYKNWVAIQAVEKKKFSPLGRTIFLPFYCYKLFKAIFASAVARGYSNSASAGSATGIYLAIFFISQVFIELSDEKYASLVPAEYAVWLYIIGFIVSIFTFLPLLTVQKAVNHNNPKAHQQSVEGKHYTTGEKVIIAVGVILFAVTLYSFAYILLTELGIVTPPDAQ